MPFSPDYDVPADRRAFEITADKNVGCLLIHGFMGSPKSTHPMARYFAEHGISCQGPLLPGHGHLPARLHNVAHQAWIAEAEAWLLQLRAQCREVFIVGHSMGGIVGAYLTQKYDNVRGLVLIAPPYVVPDARLNFTWLLRYVKPWFKPWESRSLKNLARQRVLDFDPTIDVDDPALQPWLTEATRFPMSALDEMRKMTVLGRRLWPRLTLPVLVIQGGEDIATSPETAQRVYDHIKNGNKEIVYYPNGGHELLRPASPLHRDVWNRIYAFIQSHAQTSLPTA